jgi:LPXTG-motif cell wall-anchored protein
LSIPNFATILTTVQSVQKPGAIQGVPIAIFAIAMVVAVGLLVYFKKRKKVGNSQESFTPGFS